MNGFTLNKDTGEISSGGEVRFNESEILKMGDDAVKNLQKFSQTRLVEIINKEQGKQLSYSHQFDLILFSSLDELGVHQDIIPGLSKDMMLLISLGKTLGGMNEDEIKKLLLMRMVGGSATLLTYYKKLKKEGEEITMNNFLEKAQVDAKDRITTLKEKKAVVCPAALMSEKKQWVDQFYSFIKDTYIPILRTTIEEMGIQPPVEIKDDPVLITYYGF